MYTRPIVGASLPCPTGGETAVSKQASKNEVIYSFYQLVQTSL